MTFETVVATALGGFDPLGSLRSLGAGFECGGRVRGVRP